MMVRVYGKCAFECDGCGEVYETDKDEPLEALAVIRTEGWEHRRDSDGWSHFCSDCQLQAA